MERTSLSNRTASKYYRSTILSICIAAKEYFLSSLETSQALILADIRYTVLEALLCIETVALSGGSRVSPVHHPGGLVSSGLML